MMLTDNFSESEMACPCCGKSEMDMEFMRILQKVRYEFGEVMEPTSAYRCFYHNDAVGGKTGSYHLKGMASDFSITDLGKRADLAELCLYFGLTVGINGGRMVHIDGRKNRIIFGY